MFGTWEGSTPSHGANLKPVIMKYLQDYKESKQTELFNQTNSFFAFSTEQFNKGKKEGVKYVNIGAGLICDKRYVDKLINGLDTIEKEAMKQDLTDNGKEGVIKRELANHEAYYTYDLEDTFAAIKCYEITIKEIRKVFNEEKANHLND